MNILVTGANGFIGSNLCKHLLAEGNKVRGFVRKESDLSFLKDVQGLEVIEGDIGDIDSLHPAMKNVKTVYHIAGLTLDRGPWELFERYNIEGVRNVMEAAKQNGVKKVVHTSSASIYGATGFTDIIETQKPVEQPNEPYIKSKLAAEKVAFDYNCKKMGVTVIRPPVVFGPNDRTTTMRLLPKLIHGKMPLIDKGRYVMSFVYIDNLIDALTKAARTDKSNGQAYNISDHGAITWKQFFETLCKELGVKPPSTSVPAKVALSAALLLEFINKLTFSKKPPEITRYRVLVSSGDFQLNIDKAARELDYDPEISTIEGIKKTIEWYKATSK